MTTDYTTPTDEQLVNFICFTIFGPGSTELQANVVEYHVKWSSFFRNVWLARHKETQDEINALAERIAERGAF